MITVCIESNYKVNVGLFTGEWVHARKCLSKLVAGKKKTPCFLSGISEIYFFFLKKKTQVRVQWGEM